MDTIISMHCQRCGEENTEYATFCKKCGMPLEVIEPPKSDKTVFNKKNLIPGFAILVLLLLSGGYLIYQNLGSENTSSEGILIGEVKIQTDIDTYTPTQSSTVGIGLTPIYTLGRHPDTIKFHWHTDYGYFVNWESPDFQVNLLGAEVTNNGEKIFWSYDPNEMDIEKPPVKISLKIEDVESGQLLTESILEIDWVDQNVAKIKKAT